MSDDMVNYELLNSLPLPQAAALYAEMGLPVFPLVSKGKIPLPGSKGFLEASTSSDQVREWWRQYPTANIGIPTGAVSNRLVMDIDVGEGKQGLASMAALFARHGAINTLEVRTGGGGKHLWLTLPQGGAPSRVGMLPNLDIRGEGGYVVVPPSVHISGKTYAWANLRADIAETPKWLEDAIRRPRDKDGEERAGTVEGWGNIGWWHGGPIEDGTRNDTLFSIACSAVARGYDADAVLSLVSTINHRHTVDPLGVEEIEKLVASACTKAPSFEYSDVGNAKFLHRMSAGEFVWVPEYKSHGWRRYDGTKWVDTSERGVWRKFHTVVAYWRELANRLGDDGVELKKWAHRNGADRQIRAATSQFSSLVEQHIEAFAGGLDLLPLEDGKTIFLGTNGNVEPRTSRLEDFSLHALPIKYDPTAKCPAWDKAMKIWTEGREDYVEFLWRWMGCLLTGRMLHHKMLVIQGPTKGGKTTLAEALNVLLGGFSVPMSVGLITNERNFNKYAEKERLFGKRFAYFSEATSASEFHIETVKNLTGDDTVYCRPLYGTAFGFPATFKMLLHTNEIPSARQVDPALENRLMFLRWCETIRAEDRDAHLREKLVGEASGWLNRALLAYSEVCRELGRSKGTEETALAIPQSVLDAVSRYREDMDQIGRWLDECCIVGAELRCVKADAWRSWVQWCEDNRLGRGKQTAFYSDLLGKGFEEVSNANHIKLLKGITPVQRSQVVLQELVE